MQSRSNFGKCDNSNACVSSPHSSHSTKLESTLKTEPERATCRKPETRPNKLSSKFLLSSILVGPFLHVILFHNLLFRFTFLQNTKNQIKIDEEKKNRPQLSCSAKWQQEMLVCICCCYAVEMELYVWTSFCALILSKQWFDEPRIFSCIVSVCAAAAATAVAAATTAAHCMLLCCLLWRVELWLAAILPMADTIGVSAVCRVESIYLSAGMAKQKALSTSANMCWRLLLAGSDICRCNCAMWTTGRMT